MKAYEEYLYNEYQRNCSNIRSEIAIDQEASNAYSRINELFADKREYANCIGQIEAHFENVSLACFNKGVHFGIRFLINNATKI